jgi:membrane protease YdiL (CAAX protease family)
MHCATPLACLILEGLKVSRTLCSPVSTAGFALRWFAVSVLLLLGAYSLAASASALGKLFGQAAFSLAMGALALAIAGRVGFVPATRLGLGRSRLAPMARLASISAGLGLIALAAIVLPSEAAGAPVPMLEPAALRWVAACLSLVLLPAFFEELLFRGALQAAMSDRWGPVWAILATSILFALVHSGPHGMAFAFVMGLGLGTIAHRAGGIWETIAIHAINNTIFLLP